MQRLKKSFTLVELMIVIAILAILSAIVIFALNPARIFDNFRDTKRVTDIQSINKAIIFMESWNQSGINYGATTNVYISLPDTSNTCSSYTLPTLPTGYVYYCSSPTTYKNADGTGWVPINFTITNGNTYISSLPVDPINSASYFYTYYTGGSYELTALLSNPSKNSINDEGSLTSTFEIGSPNRTWNTPLQRDKSLVGHWKFNEGSGGIVYDSSGYGNNGTFAGSPAWTVLAGGEKVLNFDGVDDFINCGANTSLDLRNSSLTLSAWSKRDSINTYDFIVSQNESANLNKNLQFGFRDSNLFFLGFYGNDLDTLAYTDTNYHYWVATYSIAGARKIYKDGVMVVNDTPATSYNGFTTLTIGARCCNNDFFDGIIDNVRIYKRVLSIEEILAIYTSEKTHYGL